MEIIDFITSDTTRDVLFKLLLSTLLSTIIGLERQLFHKPAGVKTHSLICISATLTMLMGVYMHEYFGDSDPSRLPSQILAGIGFVGAGTIIRDGFSVTGITTASSLLAITCIGLAIGAGFYEGAIWATIFIFLILYFTTPLQNLLHKGKQHVLFNVESKTSEGIISKLEEIFNNAKVDIISIQKLENKTLNSYTHRVFAKCKNSKVTETILNELFKIEGVNEVYTSKKFYRQDND